jgi:hypothetical protein
LRNVKRPEGKRAQIFLRYRDDPDKALVWILLWIIRPEIGFAFRWKSTAVGLGYPSLLPR